MRLKPLKYLLLSVLALSSWQVRAQTYPTSSKLIYVISAYPAGSGADTTVRHFAGKLAGVSGLKVVVENKVGMITVIASDYVARTSVLPDLPTMVESGIPEFDISPWWAVFLPFGAPQPIVEKLEGWFNEILVTEDTKKYLADQGATAFPGNSKLLSEHLAKEIKKWGDLLKLAKVEPQ